MKLKRQSDNPQFISTEDAELYYLELKRIPNCLKCKNEVAYHEKKHTQVEIGCHGNILRFYFNQGLLSKVEELLDEG